MNHEDFETYPPNKEQRMTTKTAVKHLAKVLTFTLLIQFSACWAADSQIDKIAAFMKNAAKEIGGTKKIGVVVQMNWSENPEVKEVAAFGVDKRIATLMAIIDVYLPKNEKSIFPNIETNSNQLAASIITRIFSLTHLSELISSSDNDVVVKDYLDGEIADLKMVLSGKINYGIYLQSQKLRGNKRAMLIYGDKEKDVFKDMITLAMNEANIAQILANKTFLISLSEACIANPDLCTKL